MSFLHRRDQARSDASPQLRPEVTESNRLWFSHTSETYSTLVHVLYLGTNPQRPFIPPACTEWPDSESALLETLAPIARFIHLYSHPKARVSVGKPNVRDSSLWAVRRIAAWRHVSPLVPFVYGAMLDDVSTCAWAIGLDRWAWDDEPRVKTKTSPIQDGVPGGTTFDVACLPYAIDMMIPPTYRWALARAQLEADLTVTDSTAKHLLATDLTAKGLTVKQVKTREAAKQLAARFRELLNAAKGEYPECRADNRIRASPCAHCPNSLPEGYYERHDQLHIPNLSPKHAT